ncbi:unnamed protein product [Prunus armeniaca]
MSCNTSGLIWLFQLWLQVYFPELGPTNVTFRDDTLLGKSIGHHVEDCFRFFYGCLLRSPSDLSMCLYHRYSGYLALDLASIPTLETKEEQRELWASILINRDLPYGLALNKGNHYPCGCKVYYPAAVGRQIGFIQGVPSPMVDSHNYFSSWRVSFKEVSEVNSVVNFNRELVKIFKFQICNPKFGFTESFKLGGGKYQPLATKEASADSNPNQDVGEDLNSSGYDVNIPLVDDTILARPRKILRNPLPPCLSRIIEQPKPTHSTMATHSAVSSSAILESQIPIFEAETEVIGANLSINPDVIMVET